MTVSDSAGEQGKLRQAGVLSFILPACPTGERWGQSLQQPDWVWKGHNEASKLHSPNFPGLAQTSPFQATSHVPALKVTKHGPRSYL